MTEGGGFAPRFLSILAANAREAFESLRRARLRTALGLIGVMIGISSVIVMVSLGEIAKAESRKQFESLGTDLVLIRDPEGRGERIEIPHALEMAAEAPSIREAAPRTFGYGSFRHAGREVGRGPIQGVSQSFATVNRLSTEEGRFISDLDTDRHWCVVGAEVAEKMREAGADRIPGEIVQVEEVLFTVVGVLEHQEENYALPVQLNANKSVFIPITTSMRIVNQPWVEVIIARSSDGAHYETVTEDVRSFFRTRSPELEPDVVTARQLIEQMEAQMEVFTLLLGSVGSISLIVGGIGIMNIMLVSVAERRTEIAVRRALGARRWDIRGQFLIESVILTSVGGVLGIVLGLVATWAITRFTGWDFLISGISVASGLTTAVAVGLFFGFQPAHQAARMDPIAGLQGQ